MLHYSPLAIRPEVEAAAWQKRNGGRIQRFIAWIQKCIPLLIYYEIPYGRASVEPQSLLRSHFPSAAWKEMPYLPDDMESVARVIASEMQLPNWYFVPNDPLPLILTPKFDDLAAAAVLQGIRQHFELTITCNELNEISQGSNPTVGQFIKDVLARRNDICLRR